MSAGRLIIVDDEPVLLEVLTSVFVGETYTIVGCTSGRMAIEAMAEGVDVLLTDKNLPDINGIDLIRHARQFTPDAEAIIITGYASLETAIEALSLGVYDYIVKPPRDVFEVRHKVRKAFEKQALSRENRRLMDVLQKQNIELEAALEELRTTQAELIQAEKLAGIGTLASGIAHEISSPLFGVMGLAEAIQEEDDIQLVQQYAADIVEYSRSIKDIVVELSGYSRAAENEYLTTVDLGRVVEDAVRLVQRSAPCEGVAFELDLPSGFYIHARTNEIQQVFVNLVRNAVEAAQERFPQGGSVVGIHLGQSDGQVWASVEDNGPGIPLERQSVIFDPFYTTKPPGKGTGLGLNIVYRIMIKYRGNISVESTPGQGARFLIRFAR